MKNSLLTFLFLLITYLGQTQNWAPVQLGEVYHYYKETQLFQAISFSLVDLGIIQNQEVIQNTFSIGVDSAILNSLGEMDYKYAQRVVPCDTCSVPILREITTLDSAYLFPEIIKKASDGYYLIINKDSIELAPNPELTNITSASQQISVQVDSTYLGTLFFNVPTITPIQDSIIILRVESLLAPYPILYDIYLSKNHGIVEFIQYNIQNQLPNFSFRLIGKEGLIEVGFTRLRFYDIFDFNVGDEFFYFMHEFDGTGQWWFPDREHRYRLRVIARQNISNDTIIYTFDKIIYWGWNIPWPMNVLDTFTSTITFSESGMYEMLEGELWLQAQGLQRYVATKDFLSQDRKLVGYDHGLDPLQFGWGTGDVSCFFQMGQGEYHGSNSSVDDFVLLYERGLGEFFRGEWYFEASLRRSLEGYIKDTVSVGQTPIIVATDKMETIEKVELIIAPNPVKDNLIIYLKNFNLDYELTFTVLDMFGRVLQSFVSSNLATGRLSISVNEYIAGVYFLQVRKNGNLIGLQRFVKQ
jgi:hypothetical protein